MLTPRLMLTQGFVKMFGTGGSGALGLVDMEKGMCGVQKKECIDVGRPPLVRLSLLAGLADGRRIAEPEGYAVECGPLNTQPGFWASTQAHARLAAAMS